MRFSDFLAVMKHFIHISAAFFFLNGPCMVLLHGADQSSLLTGDTSQWNKPVVAVGSAEASLTSIGDNTLAFNVNATSLGPYFDNMRTQAAVVDFTLKEPVQLETNVRAFYYWTRILSASPGTRPSLFWLIEDKRGFRYALAARDENRHVGTAWNYCESHAITDTEIDRLDPWVMIRLDKVDYYTSPQPPLRLLGVRFILGGWDSKAGSVTIDVAEAGAMNEISEPQEYWTFAKDPSWSDLLGTIPLHVSRFGWSGMSPLHQPYLYLADLGLSPGKYLIRWECLSEDEREVVAEGAQPVVYNGPANRPETEGRLELPLLPSGAYRLRTVAIPQQRGPIREGAALYDCIRTTVTTFPHHSEFGKLLGWRTPHGENVFDAGPASVTLSVNTPTIESAPGPMTLNYKIYSPEGHKLGEETESIASGQSTNIDLTSSLEVSPLIRIDAELREGNVILDRSHRLFGRITDEKPNRQPIPAKQHAFDDELSITKCDFLEGASPLYRKYDELTASLKTWLDEAKQTGYDTVELSAPWCEIEALPGVYDFSALDNVIGMATQRGLRVVLRVHALQSLTPGWAQGAFQEDERHVANGLWTGGNLIFGPFDPHLTDALYEFCRRLAYHYSDNPQVIGYSTSSLWYDHGLLDEPWLNQYVDYSAAARRAYVESLKTNLHTLAKLNGRYRSDFHNWEEVVPPTPEFKFGNSHQLLPRLSYFWSDFIHFKLDGIARFRIGVLKSLRKGDSYCRVAFYNDTDFVIYHEKQIADLDAFDANGSMESQFPDAPRPYRIRSEPIAKVAQTKTLVDLGMTNVILSHPGWNAFNNYWFFNWTVANVDPEVRAADQRLKGWAQARVDFQKASPVPATGAGNPPFVLNSFETLFLEFQHQFSSRLEDYGRPLAYEISKQMLNIVPTNDLAADLDLSKAPYVIIPYYAQIFPESLLHRINDYVRTGGTLVLEASGGRFSFDRPQDDNVLLKELGLPGIAGVRSTGEYPDVVAKIQPHNGVLGSDVPVVFRTKEWDPPVEDQVTPWLQNINRCFLVTFRPEKEEGQIVARFSDGSPGVTLHRVGKGRVLVFWGTIDWLASEKLLAALNQWGTGRAATASDLEQRLLSTVLVKDQIYYAIGRRFIPYTLINMVQHAGDSTVSDAGTKTLPFRMDNLPPGAYQSTDILNHVNYGLLDASVIKDRGILLNLHQGEAFILKMERKPSKVE